MGSTCDDVGRYYPGPGWPRQSPRGFGRSSEAEDDDPIDRWIDNVPRLKPAYTGKNFLVFTPSNRRQTSNKMSEDSVKMVIIHLQ